MATESSDTQRPTLEQLAAALAAADSARKATESAYKQAGGQLARLVLAAVDNWCDVASDVRNPGHLMASQLLEVWTKTMDRARAAGAGIALPGDQAGRANGRQ